MKKYVLMLVGLVVLISACSKNAPDPRYAADSKEYTFFKQLAEKEALLDPDVANELIKTSKFSVYTNDIMPIMYRQWSRFASNMAQIPPDQITQFLQYSAKQDAERRMIVAAAKDAGVSVSPDSLTKELEKIYASAGGEEKFTQAITQQGITIDFVKKDVESSLYAREYLEQEIYSEMEASEEDLQKAYQEDKTATVRHILLSTRGKSDEEKAEVKKKMEGLLERARGGEDFAKLAEEYTEDPGSKAKGGLYEKFGRGQMVKPFEDASFDLPIGSISDLVETEYGYHIVKVESRERETKPFEEVKAQLEQQLLMTQKREAYVSAVDGLKEKYKYQELFES